MNHVNATTPAPVAYSFTKGHGTQNDFVLIPDLDGTRGLAPDQVRRLADRRAGIGGDGVIRVVPTALCGEPEIEALAGQAEWFMDYRNADGTPAEMCGNGTRVFAAYLRRERLVTENSYMIATRAGIKRIGVEGAVYSTGLGQYTLTAQSEFEAQGFDARVSVPGFEGLAGVSVDMGNPHTVVMLPCEVDLPAVDLSAAPVVTPLPEHGTNVELVQVIGPGHLQMRVFERGVGETRSCGTGAAAAAVAAMLCSGEDGANQWRVDVPGGSLHVAVGADRQVTLSGPAELIADGVTRL
ncbi:diaminopimelate epimerase [Dermatophilus congolensis]|uniref:diaminopimelate epimerase n=1 Tax=Dermatophilus congolensis TaxID=1863 RepID=UPI000480952E|nr:diaminopimelate epimerase [Dermatophilus congolensis]MBO3129221.1 diaminopimelate epimerase [Dermatophilus congolensis]MBO3132147.1 diaminopimelate epimerase [Dermatophilus congolensis]MBO3133697.1 diaminopimelate epimerase [Dermatophilus congolensis]MBO3135930.1 diaminopimelate epimerase [Dermatophilus congolensis]MBO3138170.1 diaminopimelate epimerase [Dermatophilus congolensis]